MLIAVTDDEILHIVIKYVEYTRYTEKSLIFVDT